MLFVVTCPLCDTPGPAPCLACRRSLPAARSGPVPAGLDELVALVDYAGPGRRLVTTLKYANRRAAIGWVAQALASGLAGHHVDALTWAPTSRRRAAARGLDQSTLLARRVGTATGLPVRRMLRRRTETPQTGATREQRLRGPAFESVQGVGGVVAVVDDVVTTGATLTAAADALRSAGADQVIGVAVARTTQNAQARGGVGRRSC